jgi:hypothetical protein
MSLTKVSYSMISGAFVNALDYGATGNGTTDDTVALQAAIAAAISLKQPLYIPGGIYKTTAELTILNNYGVGLDVYGAGDGTTVIKAVHTGRSIVSMIGATNCSLNHLTLQGDTTTFPKIGLLLGRSSAASAGWHTFNKVLITGAFSLAGIYNIASEGNGFYDLFVILASQATAKYGVCIAAQDFESVGGLTASTMIGQMFYNASIYMGGSSGVATVYISGSISTGDIGFYGGYLVASTVGSAYVQINSGLQDGLSSSGPFVFDNVSGETIGVISVTAFKFTATSGNIFCRQVAIKNCVMLVGTSGRFLTEDSNVGLKNSSIQGWGVIDTNDFSSPAPVTVNANNSLTTIDYGYGFYEDSTYTPVITSASGTIGAYTASGRYVRNGNAVVLSLVINITTLGTASGNLIFNLPFPVVTGERYIGSAQNVSDGTSGVVRVSVNQFFIILSSLTAGTIVATLPYNTYGY